MRSRLHRGEREDRKRLDREKMLRGRRTPNVEEKLEKAKRMGDCGLKIGYLNLRL